MNWSHFIFYSSWICNGRYVSVVSYYIPLTDVIRAVREFVDENFPQSVTSPLVATAALQLTDSDADTLRAEEGGLISIVLE